MAKQATQAKDPTNTEDKAVDPRLSTGAQLPAEQKAQLPAEMADFESDRSGLENVTAADVVIPRLSILQKMSYQLDNSRPEFIAGAEVGMFCDMSTGDLFKDSIEVVPVHFARIFLEWFPRETKKGLAMNHGMDDSIMAHCKPDAKRRMIISDLDGEDKHRNGNYVAETATYFCLNLTAGGRRAFIPLGSTQLKNSRKWMTLITGIRWPKSDGSGEFQPPLYGMSWIAKTIDESNAEGNWKGWKFTPGRKIHEIDPTFKLLKEAKAFYHDAKEGLVRGDMTAQAADEEETSTRSGPGDEKEAF